MTRVRLVGESWGAQNNIVVDTRPDTDPGWFVVEGAVGLDGYVVQITDPEDDWYGEIVTESPKAKMRPWSPRYAHVEALNGTEIYDLDDAHQWIFDHIETILAIAEDYNDSREA